MANNIGSTLSLFPPVKCPICGTEIDRRIFDSFQQGRRMKFKTQAALCDAHKRRTAQAEARKRGYPLIEWETLPGRLSTFDDAIARIIGADIPSSYSDGYGKHSRISDRSFRRPKHSHSNLAGYYGPRGAEIMADYICFNFMKSLRKVVTIRDVADFINVILIPEIALMLIMEDMHVDEKKAWSILIESAAVGEYSDEDV